MQRALRFYERTEFPSQLSQFFVTDHILAISFCGFSYIHRFCIHTRTRARARASIAIKLKTKEKKRYVQNSREGIWFDSSETRLLRFERLRPLLPRHRFLQQVILDVLEWHVEQQGEDYGQNHDTGQLPQIDLKSYTRRRRSIALRRLV
jgi:hypothetical protein